MRSISALFALFLALAATPSIAADDDSPFRIDKRDFKKQYKTIALSPVAATATLKMPDSVAKMIEEEVTRHLQKRGYTVLPSSVLGGIRATMAAQVGGVEDPVTGQLDAEKNKAVQTHAYRELWFQHEFDAIATIGIDILNTHFERDRRVCFRQGRKLRLGPSQSLRRVECRSTGDPATARSAQP